MSPARQDELSKLLEHVMALAPTRELEPDTRLRRIHYDWLEAGEVTQRTVARLSEQLRRYLDDQAWLENRRIMELIRQVEQKALAMRGQVPEADFSSIDMAGADLGLPMERLLYAPPFKADLRAAVVEEAGATIVTDALFEQVYFDQGRLTSNVRRAAAEDSYRRAVCRRAGFRDSEEGRQSMLRDLSIEEYRAERGARAMSALRQAWSTPADIVAGVQRLWDSGALLAARMDGAALFPYELRLRQPGVAVMGEQFEQVRLGCGAEGRQAARVRLWL